MLNQNLRTHYTENIEHTHVSMIQPRGKLYYNRNDLNDLYKCIRGTNSSYGIAEKSQNYMPIIVDIDLKVGGSDNIKLYTNNQVKQLINIYNRVITDNVLLVKKSDMLCVYLNKDPYMTKSGEYIKNGFHLHYPKIFIDKEKLENTIIPEVNKLINEINLFPPGAHDNAVTKVPWLMYGSVKEEGLQPYKVCRIYDNELNSISCCDAFLTYKIYNEREKQIKIREENLEKYLTNILSIIPYGRNTFECKVELNTVNIPARPSSESPPTLSEGELFPVLSEENINLINSYLPHIKQEYIEDTKKWFVMYNELKYLGVENETILEICSRTTLDNYNEISLTKSLEKWNIEQFLNYGKNGTMDIDKHIENLRKMTTCSKSKEKEKKITLSPETKLPDWVEGTNNDVSNLFIENFGLDYKITNSSGSGFRWNEKTKLWEQIETNMFIDIIKVLPIVKNTFDTYEYHPDSPTPDIVLKKFKSLIKNIQTTSFQKSSWEQVYNRLYDKSFLQVVDKNPFELPIKNGRLINLKTGLITSRERCDLWSFELNFNIVENITPAEEYIATLFNSVEVRTFFKKFLGYCGSGSVLERKGFFFIGGGRNGKSQLQNILSKVFEGSTFVSSLMKAVLIKNNSHHSSNNVPTPELEPLQYLRMGFTSELDKEDKLDDNKFKSITGSDDITHRPMYMKGKPLIFKTQCKLICSTNEMPTFGVNQQAIQDRMVVIEFKNRFEDTPENRQYAEYLETPEFTEIFGSYIIQGAIEYFRDKLVYPQEVLTYTKSIFDERDTFGSFINEKCTVSTTSNEYTTKDILFENYVNYCVEEGKRFETKENLCKYLKKMNIETKQRTVNGKICRVFIGIVIN